MHVVLLEVFTTEGAAVTSEAAKREVAIAEKNMMKDSERAKKKERMKKRLMRMIEHNAGKNYLVL